MTEPQSSPSAFAPPAVSAHGRPTGALGETAAMPRHGPRDLLLGLGVLSLILSVLAILGRVAEPLNFAVAGLVVAGAGVVWLLARRGVR